MVGFYTAQSSKTASVQSLVKGGPGAARPILYSYAAKLILLLTDA